MYLLQGGLFREDVFVDDADAVAYALEQCMTDPAEYEYAHEYTEIRPEDIPGDTEAERLLVECMFAGWLHLDATASKYMDSEQEGQWVGYIPGSDPDMYAEVYWSCDRLEMRHFIRPVGVR